MKGWLSEAFKKVMLEFEAEASKDRTDLDEPESQAVLVAVSKCKYSLLTVKLERGMIEIRKMTSFLSTRFRKKPASQ